MSSSPVTVLLNVEVPASVLSRVRDISPQINVVTEQEFRARPDWLNEADVLFTQRIAPERLAAAKRLQWIQTFGAGVEWLLTPDLRSREELRVTNARGIHAQPITEHVFGLLLMFTRQLHRAVRQQERHAWQSAELQASVSSLSGATLGIVGLGAIGRSIAPVAAAFGMRVIALRRKAGNVTGVERLFGPGQLLPFLKEAEYVVNTLPLTPHTQGFFGPKEFAAMRSDAVFINVGRGGTVQTEALLHAL